MKNDLIVIAIIIVVLTIFLYVFIIKIDVLLDSIVKLEKMLPFKPCK
jgi:hypothetical protein